MTDLQLRLLGAETWGQRLARARDEAGFNLREAAYLVSHVWPVAHTTLRSLEKLNEVPPPRSRSRRALAVLALLAYGIDPADFGLSLSDLPDGVNRGALADLLKHQKGCFAVTAA